MLGHPENKNGAWGATVYFILGGAECIIVDDRRRLTTWVLLGRTVRKSKGQN